MSEDIDQELRCFCSRTPLLAKYGIRDSRPYVHIRIYKQQRIFGEFILVKGTLKIKCRDCFRWHTINILKDKLSFDADRG